MPRQLYGSQQYCAEVAISVAELDLPTIAEAITDRHEALALFDRYRPTSWLVRNEFGYVLTRYEDCVGILRDRRFFSAAGLVAQLEGVTDPEFLRRSERPSILSMEGADHSRLRRLVAPAFTPKAADRLRPFMREVIEELLAPVVPTGRCDLMADVCEPYPIPIICQLLGAPNEDWKQFSVLGVGPAARSSTATWSRTRRSSCGRRTSWTSTSAGSSRIVARGRPTTCSPP